MAQPIILLNVGGLPITNTANATPFTVVARLGVGMTLVSSGGLPVTLLNPDGSIWTPPSGAVPTYHIYGF